MSNNRNENGEFRKRVGVASPFQIDAVVERLFTFLEEEDLLQCRGVSRLWSQEARRALDNRHFRIILSEEDLVSTLDLLKKKAYTITKLVIDNRHVMYVNDRISLGSRNFMSLIRQVAPTLLSLSLQYVQCSQEVYFKIIRLLAKYNWLRHLELGTLKICEEDYVKLFPVKKANSDEFVVFTRVRFLEYMNYSNFLFNRTNVVCLASTIGRMFPNLSQMNAFSFAREKPSNFDNVKFPGLKALRLVMLGNDAPEQSSTGLTNIGVKCLMNMGMTKLRHFELFNIVPQCTMLRDFLESTATTLKRLTLLQSLVLAFPPPGVTFRLSNEDLPSPFPLTLSNLKVLHISKSFIRNLNDILISVPALENLYIDFEVGQKMELILPTELSVPCTLKQLGINWIDTPSFEKLTPFFVNIITSLELIDCYDALVKLVFENFPNLTQLVLAEKSVGYGTDAMTDTPFTGLDLKTMQNLYKRWYGDDLVKGRVPIMTKEKMDEIEKIRKGPCLANLTKLEGLVLRLIEPSKIKFWMFWPFWELDTLSGVIVSGLKITKPILRFMHIGGGFICTGPLDDMVPQLMGDGFPIKFCNEGNVKTYTFLRKVDDETEEEDEESESEDGVEKHKKEVNPVHQLYDTLSEMGSSVAIDFSMTVMPIPLRLPGSLGNKDEV